MRKESLFTASTVIKTSLSSLYDSKTNNISLRPSRPNRGRIEKMKLNFHFHTSLWCIKRFYEGLNVDILSLSVKTGYNLLKALVHNSFFNSFRFSTCPGIIQSRFNFYLI